MEKNLPRIEIIKKIIVPYGEKELAFDGDSEGPGDYQTVGRELLARNLKVPTGDYSSSLIHTAYCNPKVENEPEFERIRKFMKRGFWVFNGNLWTLKGVYVVPDLNAIGKDKRLNQDKLEKMLKGGKELNWGGIRLSEDGRVRFAPKGTYRIGIHTSESLANDGFVIAGHSSKGAEELGEVSSTFKHNPRIFGVNIQEGQNPEQRVSALLVDGDGLVVVGSFSDFIGGHAFGVLK